MKENQANISRLTSPGFDHRALDITQVTSDVGDEVVTVGVVHDVLVESTWLLEVNCRNNCQIGPNAKRISTLTLSDLAQVPESTTNPSFVLSRTLVIARTTVDGALVLEVGQWSYGTLVAGASALVINCHETIALEVGNRYNRCVDRDLRVVHTETVAVGIWVGEETRLQDRVGRRLEVGDGVRRREGSLRCVLVSPNIVSV
jgi:hypothetical protein